MPKTVLLADDSVTIQHAVGISLANEDIALVNVNNGEDAVIRARAIKPDLILLDVVMPKVSGYDACRQIRQDPSIKHTPVIMLVGAIEGFDEQKFRESMAND
ncbi:MAG: response regulator, partial [Deltaproteobacteria bacterium]|nr:response regulator [Deltaproteobacteria bacterium]